jgi:hypothetical protein
MQLGQIESRYRHCREVKSLPCRNFGEQSATNRYTD